MWSPVFECVVGDDGEATYRVGHLLVDEFLEFIAGRARPNTVKAYAHDLKVFFTVVGKEASEVTPRDVMGFITAQRRGRAGVENVVRITDGSAGLSAATIKRRLAACPRCTAAWSCGAMPGSRSTRCLAACRRASIAATNRGWSPWCGGCAGCRGSWTSSRSSAWWARCAPTATGRSCRRCCSPGSAGARSWVCGSRTCASASGGSSSRMAKAATNARCRCPPRSSRLWPRT